MSRENQRIRLTRLMLKDTLISLLKSRPLNKITVTELCAAAEINRSTFYQYYADQYALFSEMEDDLVRETDEHVSKICTGADNAQDLAALLTFVREKRDIFGLLLTLNPDSDFSRRIMGSILASVQSQVMLSVPAPIAGYVYQFLLTGNVSIIQQWIGRDFDLTVQEVTGLILRTSNAVIDAYKGIRWVQSRPVPQELSVDNRQD